MTILVGTSLVGCSAPPASTPPASEKGPPKSQAEAPATQAAKPAPAGPQNVRTSKGTFTVPGKAFADGRDLEASPRLTVMKIDVWDAVPRRQRVCQVGHGDQLELLNAKRVEDEGRYYFQVKSSGCEGWLPESFVSPKRQAPVGDRM